MDADVHELVAGALAQAQRAFERFAARAASPRRLHRALVELGWNVPGLLGADAQPLLAALDEVRAAVLLAQQAVERPTAAEAAAAAMPALQQAFAALRALADAVAQLALPPLPDAALEALAADLAEYAVLDFLRAEWPTVHHVGGLLGVISGRVVAPIDVDAPAGPLRLRYGIRRPGSAGAELLQVAAAPLRVLRQQAGADGAPLDWAAVVRPLVEGFEILCLSRAQSTLDDVSLVVDVLSAALEGPSLALLPASTPPLDLPLALAHAPVLRVEAGRLALSWAEALDVAPGADVVLFEEAGFALALSGAGPRGIRLRPADGTFEFVLQGGLTLALPLDILPAVAGGRAKIGAAATLSLRPGAVPTLAFDRIFGTIEDVRVGAVDGVLLRSASVELEGLAFPLPAVAPPWVLTIAGELAFPAADARILARATLDAATRMFALRSTGSVHLGDGLWLQPVDDATPVFALAAGAAEQHAEVHALFVLPHETLGLKSVRVDGTLGLRCGAGGTIEVLDFSAASGIETSWTLPGGLRLAGAQVRLTYRDGRFRVALAGKLALDHLDGAAFSGAVAVEVAVEGSAVDAEDIRIDARIAGVGLALANDLRISQATLEFALRTRPVAGEAPAALRLRDSAGGLFARGPGATTADDFYLALADGAAELTLRADGVDLVLSGGRLLLPREFSATPDAPGGARPQIAVADAQQPVHVRYRLPAGLAFSGRLRFQNFGVRMEADGAGPLVAVLATADLDFASAALPRLSGCSGHVEAPLPDGQRVRLDVADLEWDFGGLPLGTIALGAPLTVALGGGFGLTLLDAATSGTPGTGLTVVRAPAAPSQHEFRFAASLRLQLPEAVLAEAGAAIHTDAAGTLTLSTASGALPRLEVAELAVGGNFRLGGAAEGLLLNEARIAASGIEHLFDRSGGAFALSLGGLVVFAEVGVELELRDARFVFAEADLSQPPTFSVGSMAVRTGALFDGLPLRVTEAGIEFVDPDLPLPQLLQPVNAGGDSNIVILLGAGLDVDISAAGVMGRLDGIRATVRGGLPRVTLDGIGFGVDEISFPSVTLSGSLYLGGLEHLMRTPPDASQVFLAGKLGGNVSGTGVSALYATRLLPPMPLGLCLEVSGGAAGIPLGQTGFLLTGVSGGLSFANTNASPCDLKSYIRLGDDGRPLPLPLDDSGAPVAVPPVVAESRVQRGSDERPFEFPGCPCDCPPPSMNAFCQPHPDQVQFPGRAILKFSALSEDFIAALPVPVADAAGALTQRPLRDWVLSLGLPSPAATGLVGGAIGRAFCAGATEAVLSLWPGGAAAVPAAFSNALRTLPDAMAARMQQAFAAADGRSPWQIVCDEAYKGLPCPDVSMLVTATLSYTGVSSFLSVTGGVHVSSTGAAGVVGSLNLVGIPVGRLKAYFIATSVSGAIDPALCGELRCSVGPLDLGNLNLELSCRGFVTGLRNALLGAAVELSGPAVREIVGAVAAELRDDVRGAADPHALLALLQADRITGAVDHIVRRARGAGPDAAAARACMERVVADTAAAFDPLAVLCGRVQPRLFGLPLGNELLSANAWINRTGMGGSATFSPALLLLGSFSAASSVVAAAIAPIVGQIEQAVLGFAVKFPDVVQLAVDAITGSVATADELQGYLRHGFETMLNRSTIVGAYKISPFGLTLANAGMRVLLPDLTNHPLVRPGGWVRPENRSPAQLSRLEVLQRMLDARLLVDAFWDGDLAGIGLPGRRLREDCFPHGGVVGAGVLELPRALREAPPLDLLAKVFGAADALERLRATLEYLRDYVVKTERAGTIAFYVPAPNPPGLAVAGRTLAPEDLLRCFSDPDYAQVVAKAQPQPVNPDTSGEAFLLGLFDGRLFGVPTVDARIELVPPGRDGPGSEAVLTIVAATPEQSWPHRLGLRGGLHVVVRQAPALPVREYFEALASALGVGADAPTAEPVAAALAALPRSAADVDALFAALLAKACQEDAARAAGLPGAQPFDDDGRRDARAQARRAEADARLARLMAPLREVLDSVRAVAADARAAGGSADEQARRVAQALAARIAAALENDLPRAALEASFALDTTAIAPFLSGDVGALARLEAWTPRYDTTATGSDARAAALRDGGVALSAALRLAFSFGGHGVAIVLPAAAYRIDPPPALPPASPASSSAPVLPRLRGGTAIGNLRLPFRSGELVLANARAALDTGPGNGGSVLIVEAALAPLALGRFRVTPLEAGASALAARLHLIQTANGLAARLEISPARLELPVLAPACVLRLHGNTADQPFTLAADGSLDAGLSLQTELLVQSAYDPHDPPLLAAAAADATARVVSSSAQKTEIAISANAVANIRLLPSALPDAAIDGGIELRAASTGAFSMSVALRPLRLGAFVLHGDVRDANKRDELGAPVRAALSQYGLRITGARLRMQGVSPRSLRLRGFVIDGRGDFSVTATNRVYDIGGLLRLSASSVRVARQDGEIGVALRTPRVTLLPGTALATVFAVATVRLSSSGEFALAIDDAVIGVVPLWQARGTLRITCAPAAGGVSALLADATLSLPGSPPLPATLALSARGASATVVLPALRIAHVVEIDGGSYDFEYLGATNALTLRAGSPRLTLFDTLVFSGAALELQHGAGGVRFRTPATTIVPGLFDVDAGWWMADAATGRAGFTGTTTLLGRRLNAVTLTLRSDGDGARVTPPAEIALAAIAGIARVAVPAASFRVSRGSGGALALGAHVDAELFGSQASFDVTIDAAGALALRFGGRLRLGAFELDPDASQAVLLVNALDPAATGVQVPAATLRPAPGASVAGWPAAALALPAFAIAADGAVAVDLADGLSFAGIGFVSAGTDDDHVRLVRSGEDIELHAAGSVDFFGVRLKSSLEVDTDGEVDAHLRGSLNLDRSLAGVTLNFGDVDLGYDAADSERPFKGIFGIGHGLARVSFRVAFGPGGGEVCKVLPNDNFGPCL